LRTYRKAQVIGVKASNNANDITQNPEQPQFPLGASSDEAYDHAEIVNAPTPEIGAITARLGQQFSLPRSIPNYEYMDAEPAAQRPNQWGINPGT
jgi:hypothetical protein